MGRRIDIIANDGSPLGVTEKTIHGLDGRFGCGGAELALLTLCAGFQFYGNDVTLYNNPNEGGASSFKQKTLDEFNPQDDRDILIIFRSPNHRSLDAKGKKLWFSTDQYTVGDFKQFSQTVDRIVCISRFHKDYFKNMYGITKADVIDLPVRTWEYKDKIQKVSKRCIFTSVPDRGLMPLHAAWAQIVSKVPDASLTITSDWRLWSEFADPNLINQYRIAFAGLPNVTYRGAVKRDELIRIQMEADLHLYPCTYEELFCLHPDNNIVTSTGNKKIKDISKGEYVLSSDGNFHPVLDKIITIKPTNICEIKTLSFNLPIMVTPEHRILVSRGTGVHPIHRNSYGTLKEMETEKPEWIQAKNVKYGDFLLYPVPNILIDKVPDSISICGTIGEKTYYLGENGNTWQKYNHIGGFAVRDCGFSDTLYVNNSLSRLLGFYIAEGSKFPGGIQFSFCDDELDTYVSNVQELMYEIFGMEGKVYRRGNHGVQLVYSSKVLSKLFPILCGSNSSLKHIPVILLHSDLIMNCVYGCIAGDGSFSRPVNKNSMSIHYTSKSSLLVNQLRDILLNFGICSTVYYRKNSDCWNLILSGNNVDEISEMFGQIWKRSRNSSSNLFIRDGFLYQKVISVTSNPYSGAVYDLTVDGVHDFIANGKIAHNCIAVAESQVAGAFPVSSDYGALPTTNMGTVLHGIPTNPDFIELFVNKAVERLTDPLLAERQEYVRETAKRRFSLENILNQWERVFDE